MNFRDITNKNFRYNIRKFASFFLVSTFVVCALFLFGTLLFNEYLFTDPAMQATRGLLNASAVAIALFSIVFLIYTGFYFVRSRGKEFGVYLTLGMTSRDLSRMAAVESSLIFAGAAVLGFLSALLLGNLMYLILGRLLGMTIAFTLSLNAFLFTFGILAFIFLVQRVTTAIFIRRLDIVEIIKSTKSKDKERQRPIAGIISLLLLALSVFVISTAGFGADWVVENERIFEFMMAYGMFVIPVSAAVFFVSLFFTMGSAMAVFASICKKFPKMYHRSILLFAGLIHKLRAYRTALFSMTVLTGLAIAFIGIAMSLYVTAVAAVDMFQPHDFMIERRGGMNDISAAEIEEIVRNAGGEIGNISVVPYLDALVFNDLHTGPWEGWLAMLMQNSFVFSVSGFYALTGNSVDLLPDELFFATNEQMPDDAFDAPPGHDTLLAILPHPINHQGRGGFILEEAVNRETVLSGEVFRADGITDDVPVIEFSSENTIQTRLSTVNSRGITEFFRTHAYVIDDGLWEQFADQSNSLVVFNLARGNDARILGALISELEIRNGLASGAWSDPEPIEYSRLRPVSRQERFELTLRANGILLFAMVFLGLLFLTSSFIVLYHKFAADKDDEAENIAGFKKIGLTAKECRRYIGSHLRTVFFLPVLLGGVPAIVIVSRMVIFRTMSNVEMLRYFSPVVVMYGFILLFVVGLYFSLRKRFFKDMRILREAG